MTEPDITDIREAMRLWEEKLVQALPPLDDELEEFYFHTLLPDGYNTKLKVVRPIHRFPQPVDSLIVLLHGGSFSVGSVEMVTRPAREFAKRFGALVVAVSYRLAPEHKFPMQFQDAWDSLVWLATGGAAQLGGRVDRGFIIGGFSAGASIAATLLQQAHDRQLSPPLTGAFISIPFLLVEEIVPDEYRKEWTSREENNENPAFNKESINRLIERLSPDIQSPLFSPFNAPDPHKGLPPTYVQVGGLDLVRDDGLIYEKVLTENGVQTRLDHYPELSHAAWTIFADESSPKELERNSLKAMEWLLNGGKDSDKADGDEG